MTSKQEREVQRQNLAAALAAACPSNDLDQALCWFSPVLVLPGRPASVGSPP